MIDSSGDDRVPIEFDKMTFVPYPGDPSVFAAVTGEVIQVRSDGKIKKLGLCFDITQSNYRVQFHSGGKFRTRVVGRVVWSSFRGPVPSHSMISHIDGDGKNAALENLQLCRRQLSIRGTGHPRSRFSSRDILEIRAKSREKSLNDLEKEYGLPGICIRRIQTNESYQDVPAWREPLPASQEVKDALQVILREIGMPADIASEIASRLDCDGYFSINTRDVSRSFGKSKDSAGHYIYQALKKGIIKKLAYQKYRVPCVTSDPDSAERLLRDWEERKEEKFITDHQRAFLISRIRSSVADISTAKIRNALVSDVSRDGVFTTSPIIEAGLPKHDCPNLMRRLIADGVVERFSRYSYRFLNMPPRQPKTDDPKNIAEQHDKTRQESECTVDNYLRAIELLGRKCSLQAVTQGSSISAGVAEQLQRTLQMSGLIEILLSKCVGSDKSSYLAATLKIPLAAAQALEIHDRNRQAVLRAANG